VQCIISEKKIVSKNISDYESQVKTKLSEIAEETKNLIDIFEQLISLYNRIYTEMSKDIKLKIIDFIQAVSPLADFSKKSRRSLCISDFITNKTTLEDIYDQVKRHNMEMAVGNP